MKYSNSKPPKKYKCSKCGAHGCKLWREYQTFCPDLYCAPCAIKCQERYKDIPVKKILATMRPDGQHELIEFPDWGKGQFGDQFSWMVPAVPDEEEIGYWGYTSTPTSGIEWWKALPNLPAEVTA